MKTSSALAAVLAALFTSLSAWSQVPAADDPKPETEELQPQTPDDSLKLLVEALATLDAQQVESFLITQETYARVVPDKAPPYAALLKHFRETVQAFLTQDKAIERMQFVRVDYQFCKQPLALPKGFSGFRAGCVIYDNTHVIVRIDGTLYSFKADELIADNGRWLLLEGVGPLVPVRE